MKSSPLILAFAILGVCEVEKKTPETELDGDGDGFSEVDGDCDDTDPEIYPGAVEILEDGIDQDCDGEDPLTLPPEAVIISPQANGTYYADQLISFEGLVSDAEDEPSALSAHWESSMDGTLQLDTTPTESGNIMGYNYLREGQHAITLSVQDSMGKTVQESVVIDVAPPNSPPNCEITSPDNATGGQEGETIVFTGQTTDVDEPSNLLNVTWSSDKDGDLGNSTPDSSGIVSFAYADLSVDTHTLTMRVSDNVGETCTDSLIFTVGTPPTITIGSPIDGQIYNEGEAVLFLAEVTDGQDQPDEIALDWQVDGFTISTQPATSSGTAQFSQSNLSAGMHILVVTATDTDGLTSSSSVGFMIE